MTFPSFNAADISALKYVKKIFIMRNDLIRTELRRAPQKLFLLGALTVQLVFRIDY
jgi:hypothetical protein